MCAALRAACCVLRMQCPTANARTHSQIITTNQTRVTGRAAGQRSKSHCTVCLPAGRSGMGKGVSVEADDGLALWTG